MYVFDCSLICTSFENYCAFAVGETAHERNTLCLFCPIFHELIEFYNRRKITLLY